MKAFIIGLCQKKLIYNLRGNTMTLQELFLAEFIDRRCLDTPEHRRRTGQFAVSKMLVRQIRQHEIQTGQTIDERKIKK